MCASSFALYGQGHVHCSEQGFDDFVNGRRGIQSPKDLIRKSPVVIFRERTGDIETAAMRARPGSELIREAMEKRRCRSKKGDTRIRSQVRQVRHRQQSHRGARRDAAEIQMQGLRASAEAVRRDAAARRNPFDGCGFWRKCSYLVGCCWRVEVATDIWQLVCLAATAKNRPIEDGTRSVTTYRAITEMVRIFEYWLRTPLRRVAGRSIFDKRRSGYVLNNWRCTAHQTKWGGAFIEYSINAVGAETTSSPWRFGVGLSGCAPASKNLRGRQDELSCDSRQFQPTIGRRVRCLSISLELNVAGQWINSNSPAKCSER